jgi:hypothetical protein
MGIVTDRKGPRPAAIIGMFALFAGYYPIKLGMVNQMRLLDWRLTVNSVRWRSRLYEHGFDIFMFFPERCRQLCCFSGGFEDRYATCQLISIAC